MPRTRTLVVVIVVLAIALAYLMALATRSGDSEWVGTWSGTGIFGYTETFAIEKTGQNWVLFGRNTYSLTPLENSVPFAPQDYVEQEGRLVPLTKFTRVPDDGNWLELRGDTLVEHLVSEDGEKTYTYQRQ